MPILLGPEKQCQGSVWTLVYLSLEILFHWRLWVILALETLSAVLADFGGEGGGDMTPRQPPTTKTQPSPKAADISGTPRAESSMPRYRQKAEVTQLRRSKPSPSLLAQAMHQAPCPAGCGQDRCLRALRDLAPIPSSLGPNSEQGSRFPQSEDHSPLPRPCPLLPASLTLRPLSLPSLLLPLLLCSTLCWKTFLD